jgi:hypothetical protein
MLKLELLRLLAEQEVEKAAYWRLEQQPAVSCFKSSKTFFLL